MTTKTLAAIALAFAATGAAADDLCKSIGEAAKQVMSVRQAGASMSQVLRIADTHFQDPSTRKVVYSIVTDAYNQPTHISTASRTQAVNEFHAKYTLACMIAKYK